MTSMHLLSVCLSLSMSVPVNTPGQHSVVQPAQRVPHQQQRMRAFPEAL